MQLSRPTVPELALCLENNRLQSNRNRAVSKILRDPCRQLAFDLLESCRASGLNLVHHGASLNETAGEVGRCRRLAGFQDDLLSNARETRCLEHLLYRGP